jgi:hypothetical protein
MLYIEVELNIKQKHMYSMLYEGDLFCKYVPFVERSYIMGRPTRFSQIVKTVMSTPFISDREIHLYGEAFDRLDENGTVVISSRSINTDTAM